MKKNKQINPQVILTGIIILSVFLALKNNNASSINQTEQKEFTESINTADFVSFADWCLSKNDLKQSTKNTIDELLNEVDTLDCNLAEKRLSNISYVVLYGKDGKSLDLRPFRSLNHLKSLSISSGNISDITPLRYSKNLRSLKLGENNISDITPLQNLTELEELLLGQNEIYDISPIASLSNLEKLVLSGNNISDITPLQNLEKLDKVYLNDNQIKDETCPVKPESTCVFFLRN